MGSGNRQVVMSAKSVQVYFSPLIRCSRYIPGSGGGAGGGAFTSASDPFTGMCNDATCVPCQLLLCCM